MKKETIKEVIKAKVATKKVTAKKSEEEAGIERVEEILDTKYPCGACSGSGLERANFTNSPLCPVCQGEGQI